LTQLPKAGGGKSDLNLQLLQTILTSTDTLWASGYEIYDRISAPIQKLLESLTATFHRPDFNEAAERGGFKMYEKPRGSPENVGPLLRAVHPVVRTNPVTGWKSIFPVGHHISHINEVTAEESELFLEWFKTLLKDNHDLQVRFRWQNPNDIAIWDNRSTFHTATYDFQGLGDRAGSRAVGIGERPYFDPASRSRHEALEGTEFGKYFKVGA
jgi:alpha-ketoglutarate-dependent taurine dioxygenase